MFHKIFYMTFSKLLKQLAITDKILFIKLFAAEIENLVEEQSKLQANYVQLQSAKSPL